MMDMIWNTKFYRISNYVCLLLFLVFTGKCKL